ncbi:hypothetical protein LXJ56_27640, partial [Escherichia coli]|nr:hypothetical protein [Escherichia coli]
DMDSQPKPARSTLSMRRKKEREDAAGYKRSTYALSPASLRVADEIQRRYQLGSREAAINALLELIDRDLFLWHDILVSERR